MIDIDSTKNMLENRIIVEVRYDIRFEELILFLDNGDIVEISCVNETDREWSRLFVNRRD